MHPARYDPKLTRGDDWRIAFRVYRKDDNGDKIYDVDFTGHTGLAQLRKTVEAADVLLTFTVEIPTQTGDDLGRFQIVADKVDTQALTVESGVYDVQLTSGEGETRTWVSGTITIGKDVSRP